MYRCCIITSIQCHTLTYYICVPIYTYTQEKVNKLVNLHAKAGDKNNSQERMRKLLLSLKNPKSVPAGANKQ